MRAIILGCLMVSTNLFSQTMTNSSQQVDVYELFMLTENKIDSKNIEIQGSIYLNKEFEKADIIFSVYKPMKDVELRLDLLNTNIEILKEDGFVYSVTNNMTVSEIQLDSKTYVIRSYDSDGITRKGFFQIEKVKDVELLTLNKVIYKEGRKSTNSYSEDIQPKFDKEDEELYIKFGDHDLIRIKSNRQFKEDLKKMNKPDLYKYYNNNRIKIKDFSDREDLITYFNESI